MTAFYILALALIGFGLLLTLINLMLVGMGEFEDNDMYFLIAGLLFIIFGFLLLVYSS